MAGAISDNILDTFNGVAGHVQQSVESMEGHNTSNKKFVDTSTALLRDLVSSSTIKAKQAEDSSRGLITVTTELRHVLQSLSNILPGLTVSLEKFTTLEARVAAVEAQNSGSMPIPSNTASGGGSQPLSGAGSQSTAGPVGVHHDCAS